MEVKKVELTIFIILFVGVSVLGFAASRWRKANLDNLDEWGLGGRSFGPWVTWFLIGGDLYTAYTFVAVPALIYGAGALGFFAVPYTIIVYPLVFFVALRLWSVSRALGYVTVSDFIAGRHGSPALALIIAITGIVATMPYIALQLIGIEAVLKVMGVGTQEFLGTSEWPIIIAFTVLAAYTYQAGLRAPALIAFVKDALIYIVVLAAIIVIPIKLGGFDAIFGAADEKFAATPNPNDGIELADATIIGYSTLALGSALALFLYPHCVTGLLAARSRDTIKRNMAALPAYSLVLGLLALLGYMAIAAGIKPLVDEDGKADPNTIVPLLFDDQFPDWFAGIAFAAIGIGALVPAAIMSIAAANLFSRNIWKAYVRPQAGEAEQAKVSRLASLFVKAGAVATILVLDPQFSIDLQLIGGVIILQTLPAIVFGLYTAWFHRHALIAGWAAGMTVGMWMLYETENVAAGKEHFGGALFKLEKFGLDTDSTIYTGLIAVAVNIAVAVGGTWLLGRFGSPEGDDETEPDDYFAEQVKPGREPVGAALH
ncbi:MAG: monocarboxylate uptake permease MctP [Sporichthyaceae bacterium]